MVSARSVGLIVAVVLGAGAMAGGIAANNDEEPAQPPAAPEAGSKAATGAAVTNVSLSTVPLMPPLVVGGQEYHAVRVKGELGGAGTVELDPNPLVVDRYGNVTKTGLRAFATAKVNLVLLSEGMPPGDPVSTAKAGWRLFDLKPVPPTPAWPGKVSLRVSVGAGECGPRRLMVIDGAGVVVRILTME